MTDFHFPDKIIADAAKIAALFSDKGWFAHENMGDWLKIEYRVWRSPCRNFILKNSFISIEDALLHVPVAAIPTFHLANNLSRSRSRFLIQPVADISRAAMSIAYTYFKSQKEAWDRYDIHMGNVGMFNGLPVLIDW